MFTLGESVRSVPGGPRRGPQNLGQRGPVGGLDAVELTRQPAERGGDVALPGHEQPDDLSEVVGRSGIGGELGGAGLEVRRQQRGRENQLATRHLGTALQLEDGAMLPHPRPADRGRHTAYGLRLYAPTIVGSRTYVAGSASAAANSANTRSAFSCVVMPSLRAAGSALV